LVLLGRLDTKTKLDIDQLIGDYVTAVLEAGFVAGLKVGRDPWAVLAE